MESSALLKSTKVSTAGSCFALIPSINLLRVRIWDRVDLPERKPFWFVRKMWSYSVQKHLIVYLSSSNRQWYSTVISCVSKVTFFGNGTIPLFTQISGPSPFNVLLQISRSWVFRAFDFQTSIGMLSNPDALLLVKPFTHLFNSSMLKLFVLMGSVCWIIVLVGFGVIASGCPNSNILVYL